MPGFTLYASFPRLTKSWGWVQRHVGGVGTRILADHAELALPTGDLLCCGTSARARRVAIKTYFEVAYLGQYLRHHRPRPGDVIFDLGAHLGCAMLPWARLVGDTGHVYSCEPEPENAAYLRQTVATNGLRNVTVVDRAIGATEGIIQMSLAPTSRGHSGAFELGGGTVEVAASTVDRLVAELDLERVDLIKMDVEGMEADVLRGAAETLRRCRPPVLMAAYHRLDDAVELPRLLREIVPDYQFTADHPAWTEFDIYAWCEALPGR
ncbi:FkbM family methyltransferase [bacterium]|nr:FkbM family methyltransferase [bacterium]